MRQRERCAGLGARLRRARLRTGMTQAEAGIRSGHDKSLVSTWETESTVASVPVVCDLADVYGVRAEALLLAEQTPGTWLRHRSRYGEVYFCSGCRKISQHRTRYCPWCGLRMDDGG